MTKRPVLFALHINCSLLLALLLLVAATVPAQLPPSDGDVIVKAVRDEMGRSLSELQLRDFGKPYFVEYGVSDVETFSVTAKFGAIQSSGFDRARSATVQVRLGNYDFDNTNLFTTGTLSNNVQLSLDDDYDAIRHDLWLATDATYKTAIEQLSSKRVFLQNNVVESKLPDFSREKPQSSLAPRRKLQIDAAKWETFIRSLSAVFRKYPGIANSSVSMFVRSENRYLINSEGTVLREPIMLISINIYAETITSDNLKITPSRHIFARTLEKLPTTDAVIRTAEQLAEELTALRQAPVFDETYTGPVLFTDRAAVQLFAQMLAPNLADDRPSLSARGNESGALTERINRRVLPPSLSVYDDPTRAELKGQELIGVYEFDYQGVPARRLNLIENGILKNLPATRVPTKRNSISNGRARSAFGRPFISNLVVEAKEGKSLAELKRDLIENCRAQSLPYGIMLREIDTTFFMTGTALSVPILAYKVYVDDGREELVRNLSIDDFPIRELRQILAAGNDSFTLNHLFGNGEGAIGTPYSVTAPSVLMDEIVLRPDGSTKMKPLIITHPYFEQVR